MKFLDFRPIEQQPTKYHEVQREYFAHWDLYIKALNGACNLTKLDLDFTEVFDNVGFWVRTGSMLSTGPSWRYLNCVVLKDVDFILAEFKDLLNRLEAPHVRIYLKQIFIQGTLAEALDYMRAKRGWRRACFHMCCGDEGGNFREQFGFGSKAAKKLDDIFEMEAVSDYESDGKREKITIVEAYVRGLVEENPVRRLMKDCEKQT